MTASRIYTKTGDDGTTGLLHGGRVSKGDELVGAYGDIDEAIATLGAARAAGLEPRLAEIVLRLQRELFAVAADLAASPRQRRRLVPGISLVTAGMTAGLEQIIDDLVAGRPLRPVFVVPGTTLAGAMLDLGRAVVRRAERHAVRARACGRPVSDEALRYLNRLSDLLFVLARRAAGGTGEPATHD
ncbi:MAG TPA: cob(I)yrinic acid a,c-diamide adenosyltransferase [Streptosporangiaceae bacterium]|nr:cob(I)yrinic acid a,c-diamide adenosyltransferase [Streptosporangiaceae bacterium]